MQLPLVALTASPAISVSGEQSVPPGAALHARVIAVATAGPGNPEKVGQVHAGRVHFDPPLELQVRI